MHERKQIEIDVDVNRVIESHREALSESENDILRRLLLDPELAGDARSAVDAIEFVTQIDPPQYGKRNTGHWQVKFLETIVAATSLKDAYCKLLLLAHQRDPRFLPRFAQHKSRTRYFVAQSPEALYVTSPHLAKDHAEKLAEGWFVDTNLSESQVSTRVRGAAREAGLLYGRDVWVRESGRTI